MHSGSAELAAGRQSLRKDIANLRWLEHQAIFHPQIFVTTQNIMSVLQRHGGLFLKDANQEVRLSFFNAPLVFSLCPGRLRSYSLT
jgi:hypothetical protein